MVGEAAMIDPRAIALIETFEGFEPEAKPR